MGVVLYELITFKRPFEGETFEEVKDAIINKPFEAMDDNVDIDLKILVSKLLTKEYYRRPNIF